MTDRVLRLLGLGVRARSVVVGVTGARARLQTGDAACVVLARDAGARTVDKVERLARARGVPLVRAADARALGAALGRGAVQAVVVTDAALARGVVQASEGD